MTDKKETKEVKESKTTFKGTFMEAQPVPPNSKDYDVKEAG